MLSDEQVNKIKKKEYDAERRKQKAKDAYASKVAAQKESDDLTPEAFWAKNRSRETPAHIAALTERQDYVFSELEDMRLAISGGAPNGSTVEEWLHDTQVGVAEDIREYGICGMEIMLLNFWTSPEMLGEMTLNRSTKIFATLGYVTAVPSHRLHEFEIYLASKKSTALQDSGYVKMTCSSPQCGNAVTSTQLVSDSIAADYARLGEPFLCTSCKGLEAASRAQSTIGGRRT